MTVPGLPSVDLNGVDTKVSTGTGFVIGLDDIPVVRGIKQLFGGGVNSGVGGTQAVGDVASAVVDFRGGSPAGFAAGMTGMLQSAGIGILVSTFQPLQELLKVFTGDSSSLRTAASAWAELNTSELALAETVLASAEPLSGWVGDAADACRTWVQDLRDVIELMAGEAALIAQYLSTGAVTMDSVRGYVNTVISITIDFAIATMATAAATSVVSFGTSIGIAIGVVAIQVGFAVADLMSTANQLESYQQQIGAALDQLGPDF